MGSQQLPTAHVEYAYNPRQGARTRGGYHLILDQPLTAGRLTRETGDALCKPADQFWGLEPGNPHAQPSCPTCLHRAGLYGITLRALQ